MPPLKFFTNPARNYSDGATRCSTGREMEVIEKQSRLPSTTFNLSVFVGAFLSFVAVTSVGAGANPKSHLLLDRLPDAHSTELRLVMIGIEGCPFCMRWESQVGQSYSKSAEAKIAPLVRVRIGSESLMKFEKIKYTPTFLVLKGTTEIGRIAGYRGADPFWEELGHILNRNELRPRSHVEGQP